MTACSTVLAVLLTPLLVWLLGGEYLPADTLGMFLSVVKIVLLPVGAGIAIHAWKRKAVERAMAVFPAVSVLFIVFIIAAIVGLSHEELPRILGIVGVVVLLHNLLGLAAGYGLAALFRLPRAACRTVAIEVGMQNSGLGVALAMQHFNAGVALPASLFSVVHNLTGSTLSGVWRRYRADDK